MHGQGVGFGALEQILRSIWDEVRCCSPPLTYFNYLCHLPVLWSEASYVLQNLQAFGRSPMRATLTQAGRSG